MIALHTVILVTYLFALLFASTIVLEKKPKSKVCTPFWKLGSAIYRKTKIGKRGNIISRIQVLFPLSDRKKIGEIYYTEKIGFVLLLIFIGNALGLLIACQTYFDSDIRNHFLISRNPAGGGEKTVELDIYSDGRAIEEGVLLTIGEQKWSREETQEKFREMIPLLEKAVLGKNTSFEHIQYDLNLVDRIDPYPIDISWKMDDYSVMNGNGVLQEESIKPEGVVVQFTAILSYYEEEMEHKFHACIYPLPRTQSELFKEELHQWIQSYEKSSSEYPDMILPDQYNGKPLSYETHRSNHNIFLFVLFIIAAILIYLGKDKDLEKEIHKRELQMKKDYPEIVSKLTLLIGAGMTLRSAFEKTADDYEKKKKEKHFAYEEMLFTVREMKSGIAEGEAYIRFGNRCRIREFLKLGALLSQNLKKGSTGLLLLLEAEEKEAFEERKSLARRLGEEAGTKLLLPMGMMLIVVMIIVIIPAFLSFTV